MNSNYKNDFQIYECFENSFGQNLIKMQDNNVICKMAKPKKDFMKIGTEMKEFLEGGPLKKAFHNKS